MCLFQVRVHLRQQFRFGWAQIDLVSRWQVTPGLLHEFPAADELVQKECHKMFRHIARQIACFQSLQGCIDTVLFDHFSNKFMQPLLPLLFAQCDSVSDKTVIQDNKFLN